MRSFVSIVLFLFVGLSVLRAEASTDTIRLVIIGDSTVANYPDDDPKRGWGQLLPSYLNDNVEVENLAIPGATSKSFLASKNWPKAVDVGGDFLLIQFGHNDGKIGRHPDAVEAGGAFSDNLKLFVNAARKAGMEPVFVTPMHRVKYQADGSLTTELAPYAAAMRKVAEEENVTVIDLYGPSGDWFLAMGDTEAHKLNPSNSDRVHFNQEGAALFAAELATQLIQYYPVLSKTTQGMPLNIR